MEKFSNPRPITSKAKIIVFGVIAAGFALLLLGVKSILPESVLLVLILGILGFFSSVLAAWHSLRNLKWSGADWFCTALIVTVLLIIGSLYVYKNFIEPKPEKTPNFSFSLKTDEQTSAERMWLTNEIFYPKELSPEQITYNYALVPVISEKSNVSLNFSISTKKVAKGAVVSLSVPVLLNSKTDEAVGWKKAEPIHSDAKLFVVSNAVTHTVTTNYNQYWMFGMKSSMLPGNVYSLPMIKVDNVENDQLMVYLDIQAEDIVTERIVFWLHFYRSIQEIQDLMKSRDLFLPKLWDDGSATH